jgi:hypothetical protein
MTVPAVTEHLDTAPQVIATCGRQVGGSVYTAIDVSRTEERWEFVRPIRRDGARGNRRRNGAGADT